jgi:hypothetical protein
MPQSLSDLEAKRASVLQQFVKLGDLRSGSISSIVRRCGSRTAVALSPTIRATIRKSASSAK